LSSLSAASSLLNLGLPILMARVLGPEENGVFRIFALYLLLVPNLSFATGLLSGLYYWGGHGDLARLKSACAWLLRLGILSSALLLALHRPLAEALGFSSREAIVFALAALPTVVHAYFESVAIARGRVWLGAGISAGFELLRAMAMLLALWLGRDVFSVVAAHAGVLLLKLLLTLALAKRESWFSVRAPESRAVWSYAAPVSAAALFDMFLVSSDRLLVSGLSEPAVFALYAMGCLAVPPLQVFEQSVNKVLIPMLAARVREGQGGASALVRGAIEQMQMIFVGAAAGMAVFAPAIVELLFTARYAEAVPFLRLYAVNYLLIGIPFDAYFRAAGDSRWILRNAVGFGSLALAMVVLCTWAWGPYGALASMLGTQALMRARAMARTKYALGCSWAELIPYGPLALALGAAGALSALSLAVRPLFVTNLLWFLVAGGAFAVIYGLAVARRALPSWRKI
jgi:O-antigen/teichoic acid export membrane protein